MAYALSDKMKIIDLKWPSRSLTTSRVDYPNDSWSPCFRKSQVIAFFSLEVRHSELAFPWEYIWFRKCTCEMAYKFAERFKQRAWMWQTDDRRTNHATKKKCRNRRNRIRRWPLNAKNSKLSIVIHAISKNKLQIFSDWFYLLI